MHLKKFEMIYCKKVLPIDTLCIIVWFFKKTMLFRLSLG